MRHKKSKNFRIFYIVVFCIALVGSFIAFQAFLSKDTVVIETNTPADTGFPEVKKILATKNVEQQKPYLLALLKRVGPEQTQEALYRSGLPFTGETHLLIHTIGDYIYKKYGNDGLHLCRDYFLSACFHAFIIDDLGDHGINGLAKSIDQCAKAGSHVLGQCSHASGHGFLAWKDYEPLEALKMCDQLGDISKSVPLFNCYDGVFMENIYGIHSGHPSPKRWVKKEDPFYPCNDPRIPEKYILGCWSNQVSLMRQSYGAEWKTFAANCDQVQNPEYQKMCYNNFARQIHPETFGKADIAMSLCENATGRDWQNYCHDTIIGAAYSVGDRTNLPFEICRLAKTEDKQNCYTYLFQTIEGYEVTTQAALSQCKLVKDPAYQKSCADYQTKSQKFHQAS